MAWTCCGGGGSYAVDIGWDRATRVEARDFSCWIQLTIKQRRKPTRQREAFAPGGGVPNPVTGKPSAGDGYALTTVVHSETVLRGFYDFHRDAGSGPILNPFPLDLSCRAGRANAHHNPMDEWRPERVGVTARRFGGGFPRDPGRSVQRVVRGAVVELRSRSGGVLDLHRRRASELLGVRQCDVDPGQQLITVVRKGSRAMQQVPASATRSCGYGCIRSSCGARFLLDGFNRSGGPGVGPIGR